MDYTESSLTLGWYIQLRILRGVEYCMLLKPLQVVSASLPILLPWAWDALRKRGQESLEQSWAKAAVWSLGLHNPRLQTLNQWACDTTCWEPDYGETKMQALPGQKLEVIQQHAMAMHSEEFAQLMASWARFVALLLAEVNHAMVETKRKQAKNREQWTLPDTKKDGDKDDGPHGNPDGGHGDLTSMMQREKPTPVFTQMRRLRQGMELLPPRRRSVRSFLLL